MPPSRDSSFFHRRAWLFEDESGLPLPMHRLELLLEFDDGKKESANAHSTAHLTEEKLPGIDSRWTEFGLPQQAES